MSYEAKIIADSVAPHGGRLTTFQLRFPRFILAQFNTYGSIAKNARSSRAVPTERLITEVETDPVVPIAWGRNGRGMVAASDLDAAHVQFADSVWVDAILAAVKSARSLAQTGVHKQLANRVLEPFLWVDVVATATGNAWLHYFAQRCAHDAQPEHQHLARLMARAYRDSTPYRLEVGWWHLPYATVEELAELCAARNGPSLVQTRGVRDRLLCASVARCRRVSYRPFDGEPDTHEAEKIKHDECILRGHWSPLEHQGMADASHSLRSGRMTGWLEYRQCWDVTRDDFDFDTIMEV